jgi:hypothetical protein
MARFFVMMMVMTMMTMTMTMTVVMAMVPGTFVITQATTILS